MGSVGMDLKSWSDKGLLRFRAERPSLCGFEPHLAVMFREIRDFQPDVVVVDPLSALLSLGATHQTQSMLLRLIDHLKSVGVTGLFTTLQKDDDQSGIAISSIMDSWIHLENLRVENDAVRRLHVIKSRGMAHATDTRRILITSSGVQLVEMA
jgi:circadian clock protein KaiC